MRRRVYFGTAALLTSMGAAAAVFGYNIWSFCCGRCTASTFITIGPFGVGLVGLILVAWLVLLLLRYRARRLRGRFRCACGALLLPKWLFCPDCGEATGFNPSPTG